MPDFVLIDDHVTDEWYPGFAPSGAGDAARPSFLYNVLSTAFGGKTGTA